MHHQLTQNTTGFACTTCGLSWVSKPKSSCIGLPAYRSWESIPEGLHTETQLKKMRLRLLPDTPPAAVKLGASPKYDWWLYWKENTVPMRKTTPAQKAGRAKAWKTTQEKYRCPQCNRVPESIAEIKDFHAGGLLCSNCAEWEAYEAEQREIAEMIVRDHAAESAWGREMLGRDDWCLLDTETTSLTGYTIEIGVVDPSGRVLFESRVDPRVPVTPEAYEVHGIADADLVGKPTLPEIWDQFISALAGRTTILAYNAAFDQTIIQDDAARYGLSLPKIKWDCLMLRYSAWCGNWNDYHNDYTWVPLLKVAGLEHNAVNDALAALQVMKEMASGKGEGS